MHAIDSRPVLCMCAADQVDLPDGRFKCLRYHDKGTTHLVKSPSNIDLFCLTSRHYEMIAGLWPWST